MWGRIYPHITFLIFTNIILKALCVGTSSLTFVIDDTGSMHDDIALVKRNANKIMDIVFNEKASLINNMVLVSVNDPNSQLRAVTKDRYVFKQAIQSLYAHNIVNRDCPEPSMQGLILALDKSLPGSYIYVFTDASAKDYYKSAIVKEMCQRKQSQDSQDACLLQTKMPDGGVRISSVYALSGSLNVIVFVLTGHCYHLGDVAFRVYFDIATACSGLAFYVDNNGANQVIRTIEETIKGNKTVMVSRNIPAGTYADIPFTVDDQTDYAIVSVSGAKVSLSITGPPASQERIMWHENGKVIKLNNATPGKYVANVMGHTTTSVVIVGRTDFIFTHGFSALLPKTIAETTFQPIAEANVHLLISVTDPKHLVNIESVQILNMDEKPIGSLLPLTQMYKDFYITRPFQAPSERFKLAVHGKVLSSGKPIIRINKIPITPQEPPIRLPDKMMPTASIEEGTSIELEYNSSVKLTCKVKAFPKPQITWVNSKGNNIQSTSSVFQYPYEYISYMALSEAVKTDKYSCYAVNEKGKDSKTISIDVKDAFDVKDYPEEETTVMYGTEATIPCEITSKSPMQIVWYYVDEMTGDSGKVTPSDKYRLSADGTRLTIVKMDLDLVGIYICKASLINNKDVHKTFNTRVKIGGLKKPKITAPSEQKVILGANTVLTCTITGVPKPKISWQFKGATSTKYTNVTSSASILQISKVSDPQAGQYKCLAENSVGKDKHVITLIIQELPKITSRPTSVYKSKEGDAELRLPCVATGRPVPVITWKLNKIAISANEKYDIKNGAMIIKNPTVSDTHMYICEARNEVGVDTVAFQTHILQAPKVSGVNVKKVKIGTAYTIECQVIKGEPKPTVTWQFMDKPGSKFVPIAGLDTVLRISNAEHKHAGLYTCVAQNKVGSAEHVTTLIVQEPPKITVAPTTKFEGIEGNPSLTIPCVATGLPKPDITWKVNDYVISENGKYSIKDGALIIRNPTVDDTGIYACNAQNEVGATTVPYLVKMLQAPKVSGRDTKTVKTGVPVSLECQIDKGIPKPNITWQYIDIHGSKFETIPVTETTLRIIRAERKLTGHYKCVAQNKVGSDEHTTILTVQFAPEIFSKPSIVEGVEGDIALRIPCDVIGVPKPVISWKLQGKVITPSAKYAIEDGALVIRDPKTKDSSRYTCTAANYLGSVTANFEARVDKYLEDYGVKDHIYILVGETKKLKCQNYTSATHSIKWFTNGEYNNSGDTHDLVNATVGMDANYTCRANDKHGNTHTHNYVVDVGFPPTLCEEAELDEWRGDETDILTNCDAEAKPPATVQWYFNGQVLPDYKVKDIGITYKWGHYSCNISNVHGSKQRSFDVKSSVCLINRNLEDAEYLPIILTDLRTWPKWETTKHYSVVEVDEKVIFTCPNHKGVKNVFKNFTKQNELKAVCNNQDTFLVNGKVYKLTGLQCSVGMEPNIIRKKAKCLTEKSELIRVGYNLGGFLETYEVCYDHDKNIPLYTRVHMTATDGSLNPAHNWFKHPGIGDGKIDKGFSCLDSTSSCCYNKSQLVNARDFNYDPAKYSTFIDPLNVVPAWQPCKKSTRTSWQDIDELVRHQLINYSQFIAWSGTHTLKVNHGEVIPRYLWKVLRFDEDQAMAIVYVNDPSPMEKDIKCENICTRGHWLNSKDKYTYCCKLKDFLEAFGLFQTDIGEPMDDALEKIEKST